MTLRMEDEEPWRQLSVPAVMSLNKAIYWTDRSTRGREPFFKALSGLPEIVKADLYARAWHFLDQKERDEEVAKSTEKIRKRMEKSQKMQDSIPARLTAFNTVTPSDNFLKEVGEEKRRELLGKFIDATSMKNVRQAVCCCCAGLFEEVRMRVIPLDLVPHRDLLRPAQVHRAHTLTEGMLLEPRGLLEKDRAHGYFCKACEGDLHLKKVPKFSLANNMWLGDIPFELEVLTVPERLLIAIYYPAVYVYKLFPKSFRGGRTTCVSEKMHGNVTTYRLAPQRMADLATGGLLPRRPDILASLISITLVGYNQIPEKTLKGILQIRRSRILAAITWLKSNNPFYANIEIDATNLQQIPEGEIPDSVLMNVRVIEDMSAVNKEQETYVPDLADENDANADYDLESVYEELYQATGEDDYSHETETYREGADVGPDIFPIHETAVVDVNGVDVDPAELFYESVNNSTMRGDVETREEGTGMGDSSSQSVTRKSGVEERREETDEASYYYRHGNSYINEYPRRNEQGEKFEGSIDNPNHLLGAFPYLFPYGLGGFETKRPRFVSYAEHAKWAVKYCDRRFSKNMTFMSQVFNVLQKREVCRASDIQVSRRDFVQNEMLFRQITAHDLKVAADREKRGLPVTDPKIKRLRKLITATRRHVRGTDENRQRLRSRIHGMTMMKGPPTLWLTINFADMKEPLVQVFAGEDINMDDISAGSRPSAETMSRNTSENPVAAAKAFYFMMALFFKVLLGIEITTLGELKRQMGIFGMTESYIASIEAQGRGTLHAHILIWLSGSPTADEMQKMLQDPLFRQKMEQFIALNIKSHVEGLDEAYLEKETSKDIRSLKEVATAYSRPLDPRIEGFHARVKELEFASARVHHVHVCSAASCLLPDKSGRLKCKRRAPWRLADETRVYENGEWESKRTLKWLNTWCLLIMLSFRCNHDIKILINAGVSKDLAWYITKYASKAQGKSFNVSALLATRYARNWANMAKAATLREANKKMLSQCVNTLSRYQEFSAQQLAGFLMGRDDRFESHKFVSIHLRALMASLKDHFPELNGSGVYQTENRKSDNVYETGDDGVMLSLRASGSNPGLHFKSQVHEYMQRGHLLDEFCFLLFHLETYEAKNRVKNEDKIRHVRIPYLDDMDIYRGRSRILRGENSDMIPDFLGSWPPRDNDPESRDLYCSTILALLKPWRRWSDLKGPFTTWDTAYEDFNQTCSERCRNIIRNIRFYYESQDTATANRLAFAEEQTGEVYEKRESEQHSEADDEDMTTSDIEEDVVKERKENASATRERLFGENAITIASQRGIFAEYDENEPFQGTCSAIRAGTEVFESINEWRKMMKGNWENTGEEHVNTDEMDVDISTNNPVPMDVEPSITVVDDRAQEKVLEPNAMLDCLTDDQRRACTLVQNHLSGHLEGKSDQLLMLIMGSGGVGKSVVIKAIEDIFKSKGVSNILAKTATTGVAASHIQGSTLHFWAGMPIYTPPANGTMRPTSRSVIERREANIAPTRYLIIDEVSMLTLPNLGLLSRLVSDIHDPKGENSGSPFGGKLNVILVGDFHQFPPPAMNKFVLFRRRPPSTHIWAQIGYNVFSCFKTAVVLKQQMRAVDAVWSGLLERVRYCETTAEDVNVLKRLTLTRAECDVPDFNSSPWNRAVLITSRHAVREAWNKAMIRKISFEEKKTVLICPSHDYGKGKVALTTKESEINNREEDGWTLPREQELFEGMRVIITSNIDVKSQLANGSIGTLEKIYLDPREPPIPHGARYHRLQYKPVLLLFRPDNQQCQRLKNLPDGILPIEASKLSRRFALKKRVNFTVHREQFAVTAAYAFTDYKSQGQTLSPVIIDIGKPPTGVLTPFNTYVALSRSKSREHTRLLRDFDIKVFTDPMNEDLQQFDKDLENMNQGTKAEFEGSHIVTLLYSGLIFQQHGQGN